MPVETALIALGTVAVRTAAKLWLGDHEIAAEVGGAGRRTSWRCCAPPSGSTA
ncbi:hypothetical protein VSH64_10895 [Amycolatopsis rhabdoformis]|uniref:Uncharacterized protein n=1 Tax=Amycolatopsis rhabdoformis TaxID=1448059 RepID=A0ABZ1IG06_9PSEU|nr:hypothetical protein [Amycolatopsis rhabdoformis]WSE32613.1 hypothetical protein VSH64_10895 [Amycolatopsis rhabdoformis]